MNSDLLKFYYTWLLVCVHNGLCEFIFYDFWGHTLSDYYFNVNITKFPSPWYTHTYDYIISYNSATHTCLPDVACCTVSYCRSMNIDFV